MGEIITTGRMGSIRELAKARGKTMIETAKALKVSRGTLYTYDQRPGNITWDFIVAFSRYLGVSETDVVESLKLQEQALAKIKAAKPRKAK